MDSIKKKMIDRRKFIKHGTMGVALLLIAPTELIAFKKNASAKVISTWRHGLAANEDAWKILSKGGTALDAVEQGVRNSESDPKNRSVGLGGNPDRDGFITLDACIMDHKGNAGSVAFLQDIEHPISVARRVMEKTPHVMLVGEGAQQFALEEGFVKRELHTEASKKAWKEWLKKKEYVPKANIENHDTIGMIAMDANGDLSGACTTSGMAYKLHGRVGDSPIIGAGLYVDNDYGGATATGVGELVMKTLGSFLVVELMRNGRTAQEACEEAVMRIVSKLEYKDMQVGYLAMDKKGGVGAYSVHAGFNYAVTSFDQHELIDAQSYAK